MRGISILMGLSAGIAFRNCNSAW